jgi:radical SAM protein with 4Fe4S-binding SPASM domain
MTIESTISVPADEVRDYLMSKAEAVGIRAQAFLEITTKCNFKCIHCFNACSLKRKELTYNEIRNVLDQLADIGCILLRISGGEPLIRNDFWKIIEYARRKEFMVRINSNGSLITCEIARRLVDLAISRVEISIYGMNEDTYKLVTNVRGAFGNVMHAIERIKKEGLPYRLKMILMRDNFSQLAAFKRLGKNLGVQHQVFFKINPRIDGCRVPINHQITFRQMKQFLEQHPQYCQPAFNSFPSPLGMLCETGGLHQVIINSTGDVMPCIYFSSIGKHMNIRNKSISEILKKDSIFRRLKDFRWKNIPECLRCDAAGYCFMCAKDFLLSSGRLRSSPIKKKCRIARLAKTIYGKYTDAPKGT